MLQRLRQEVGEFKPELHRKTLSLKKQNKTPVILTTWEAEIRRITVQG
jgi:hypothetical protein